MRRYIEQTTQPDGTVTETPLTASFSIDKTYLKAFGLEDDPQPETIL